jgi:hypothetical protein
MTKKFLLTLLTSAALLMGIAGSSVEAARWNRGISRRGVQYRYSGVHGRGFGNENRQLRRQFNNSGYYGNRNSFGNPYGNSYRNGRGVYFGSNNGGFYFRY